MSTSGLSLTGSVKEQLGTIYKQIREAQTLDVNGDEMVRIWEAAGYC